MYYVMVGIFSSIAYLCAFFFDLAVQLSLNSSAYALTFLSTAWEVARDIANMSFIFILVYLAITIILEANTATTSKTLAAVIIVALLVNFSFLFTRLVIDSGNIIAVQFYNAIDAGPIGQTANQPLAAGSALASVAQWASAGETKDLTSGIMNALSIQTLFDNQNFKEYVRDQSTSAMYLMITLSLIYFFVGIMFAILAGSFLFAGAKFVMRIVGLWAVLFASPLALIARALQGQFGWAGTLWTLWWKRLLQFSFYPAIYLFMFWILSIFMKELGGNSLFNSVYNAAGAAKGASDADFLTIIITAMAGVALRMGFIVAFMYLALSTADMVVKTGSTAAGRFSSFMGNAVSGGALGVLGRNTLGLASRGIQRTRLANPVSERFATSTYDVRNTKAARYSGVAPLLRSFEPATAAIRNKILPQGLPIDFGKASTGAELKKAAQEREKEEKAAKRARADEMRDKANKEAIERLAKNIYPPTAPGASQKKADEDRVKNFGKREVENLKAKDLENIAHLLKESQLKIVKDSDKFTEDEKDKVEAAWHDKASGSPLGKSQGIIEELRKIDSHLTAAAKIPSLTTHTAAGTLIDSSKVAAMINDAKQEVALTTTRRDAAVGPGLAMIRTEENRNLQELKDALEALKKLDTERKGVPINVGGAPNAGEFVVK